MCVCLDIFSQSLNLLSIAFQPAAGIDRELVHLQATLVGISQYRCGAVVSTDNHETVLSLGIENIELVVTHCSGTTYLLLLERLTLHKLTGNRQCLLFRHVAS